jgi:hypothetical protein
MQPASSGRSQFAQAQACGLRQVEDKPKPPSGVGWCLNIQPSKDELPLGLIQGAQFLPRVAVRLEPCDVPRISVEVVLANQPIAKTSDDGGCH